MNLETAIAKLREPEVLLLITEQSEENVTSVELKSNSDEVRAKQWEDLAIATILQKSTVPLNDRQYNCSTFGVKPMTREQAQKLAPEASACGIIGSNSWWRMVYSYESGIPLAKTTIKNLSLYHKFESAAY